jgi:nucleotide-binding universal stress UspA family protein
MKIVLAADGSRYTKKALAYLVTHEALTQAPNEIFVLNVQAPLPPRVKGFVGQKAVNDYHADDAEKVMSPIRKFLQRHKVTFHEKWLVGQPASEILKLVHDEKAHLIVMGTHGHSVLGRILLGSVAQKVVSQCDVPILLVK